MSTKRWMSVSYLLLVGCVSIGNSEVASETTIAQIKVGETTKQQVTALLGDPMTRRSTDMAGSTQEWWAYSYSSSTINPLEYIFLYGFFVNGIGLPDTRHDLHLFFDHKHTVRGVSRLTTSYDMGGPLRPLRVTSTAVTTLGYVGRSEGPVQFKDKMEFQY